MTRKTKAELEAEIIRLTAENIRLQKIVTEYEKEEIEITKIEQQFIEQYGPKMKGFYDGTR